MELLTDPYAWWIEPFLDFEFMRQALLAGVLAAICTSVVGTWVVLRGMSFLGDALAHGVLPGIGIAFIIGVNTTLGALIAALAMVGGVSVVRARSPLPEDTAIGVLFVGFLALAVVIMSSQSSYAGDLNRFLFGSVTGLDGADVRRQALAAVVAVIGVVVLYRSLLVSTFDRTQAALLGLRPRLTEGLLLALVAVSIVASFETVGSLLVFAFLVAPPATAALLVKRVPLIMVTAAAIGSFSVLVGVLVSYHHETAASATMALAAVACFVVALGVSVARTELGNRVRRSAAPRPTA